ncbi:hypothetical protein [Bradyrhizobium sp. HKCCYLR20261]|uniref:hypothetical protein n=1 Tax=Bradyrhizobium sp. HKCCYLR20261 TaxID=3420760 RepID=UPI003EB93ECC
MFGGAAPVVAWAALALRGGRAKGSGVPERDKRAGCGGTMLTIDQGEGSGGMDQASRSLALMPGTGSDDRRGMVTSAARPDAGFVTQLIATAEQLPQTRALRRAAAADVHRAYSARLQSITRARDRTRDII